MGFWNKLGKIALQAAPYVAAPFTGGASLMATGATQKLGQKWAESDAKKAIAKGLAPSKFDKYLGMASGAAGLGSMAFGSGLLGGAGKVGAGVGKGASLGSIASKAGTGASKVGNVAKIASAAVGKDVGGWQGALGKIAGNAVGNKVAGGSNQPDESKGWEGQLGELLAKATAGDKSVQMPDAANQFPADNSVPMPDYRAAGMVNGFPLNQGQPKPRNYNPIEAGRNVALMSQPWRTGYETRVYGPDDAEGNPQIITNQNPAIYPNYNPPVQAPPVSENGVQPNLFGDNLTPRYGNARKRNPAPVEEEY